MAMKKLAGFCIFVGIILAVANAQDTGLQDDLKQAGAITDTSVRLEAYDSILEKFGLREPGTALDAGKWTVSTKINPVDDSQMIFFILTADSGEGVYGGPVALIIRYSNDETEVYINWGSYMGSEVYVTLRLGQEPAQQSEWMLSSDSKATFYPGSTVALIKKILGVDKLVAQSVPYSENPITAIFDVRGLKNAATPYAETLGW